MIASPPLPPPTIAQPAAYQVSYGLVTGRAAAGTRRVVVSANRHVLRVRALGGRRFSLRVDLPPGDLTLRVKTIARDGRTSSSVVKHVFGLPPGARPRFTRGDNDPYLARELRSLAGRFGAPCGLYVQSLTGGRGAAWNAKARLPAASTLKMAVAAAVLARLEGPPAPGSGLDRLFTAMITRSDNASANALEVWLAGSTSAASRTIDALMRSVGMTDSLMYGGYEVRTLQSPIPVRVEQQPGWGYGKYTTASDLARLLRAIWLASGGIGPLPRHHPGFTGADARYLLWLLAHVRDAPKLDRVETGHGGVVVLHKAGWIDGGRHDAGLVFWPGGVFVVGVMTWSPSGVGTSADVLAGRVATLTLQRLRRREG